MSTSVSVAMAAGVFSLYTELSADDELTSGSHYQKSVTTRLVCVPNKNVWAKLGYGCCCYRCFDTKEGACPLH